MMTRCIAFLRGINVGRAKRIAMADLRALIEGLGFSEVRTLLNSGNVVFDATRPDQGKIALAIQTTCWSSLSHPPSKVEYTENNERQLLTGKTATFS